MNQRDAMKMALEALDRMYTPKRPSAYDFQAALDAINAIRTALAEPERKPLTDEKIWLEYQRFWPFHPAEEPRLAKDIAKFARAIERAHGIGG
jgi:hypothetical protein